MSSDKPDNGPKWFVMRDLHRCKTAFEGGGAKSGYDCQGQ